VEHLSELGQGPLGEGEVPIVASDRYSGSALAIRPQAGNQWLSR